MEFRARLRRECYPNSGSAKGAPPPSRRISPLARAAMDLAKNLKIDSVSRLHPNPPHRVSPSQSVAEAVSLMRRERVGCVLVTEGDRLLGIFTERDLVRKVMAVGKPLTVPVSDCMTPNPIVVYP